MRLFGPGLTLLLAFALAACAPRQIATPNQLPSDTVAIASPTDAVEPTSTPSTTPEEELLFAVIGDFGQAGDQEQAVADMVKSWDVDFILTTGDNNYPDGAADSIDTNIGQYYHEYIGNYTGKFGEGGEINRFFPSLGNHDWIAEGAEPYLDYFTLPGNERYYEISWPPVHLFVLDSDPQEPDGVGLSSAQAAWLQLALAASSDPLNLVIMHHPAFSSGMHGSSDWMQWPYAQWGADVVLAGHDHLYERLVEDGLLYLTNGLGGNPARYDFVNILPESQFRYNAQHGALRVQATSEWIRFEFINTYGEVVDQVTLAADDMSQ